MSGRAGGILDLWLFSLDVAAHDLGPLEESLSDAQRTRMQQLGCTRAQARYAAMHGQVRQVLTQRLGMPPRSVRIGASPLGKPCLPDVPQLGYNISHCQAWGLLGLTHGAAVGVDLEHVTARRARLAKLILSDAERLAWAICPAEDRAGWITRAWVRKEAVVKATGTGLGTKLTDVEVMGAASLQGQMLDLDGPPAYSGAVYILPCAGAPEVRIHTPHLSISP